MKSLHVSLAACAALFAFSPAHAVDGVILIDQNRAMAGNVTPGDTAGFPVSINQPGSYRLSGNLTVPAGVNGIELNSDDVTLDLNGFRMAGSGIGIRDPGSHQRNAVSNGVLSGFGIGIHLQNAPYSIVRDIRTTNVSGISIVVGEHSLVQRNIAQGLIQIACPSVATENLTDGYLVRVVSSSADCVVWNNRSYTFTGAVVQ